MYAAQLIISIVFFAILYLLKRKADSNRIYLFPFFMFIFMLFYFTFAAFKLSRELSIFYQFGLVITVLGITFERQIFSVMFQGTSTDVNGTQPGGVVSGWGYDVLSAGLAFIIFGIAKAMTAAKGQIMGVVPLAINSVGDWQTNLQLLLSPATSGVLGMVENYVFFIWLIALIRADFIFALLFRLIGMIPIPGLAALMAKAGIYFARAMAYIVMCLSFGLFHIVSYLGMVSNMLWAATMMALMIAASRFAKNISPANSFHYWWNALITMGQSLTILK